MLPINYESWLMHYRTVYKLVLIDAMLSYELVWTLLINLRQL